MNDPIDRQAAIDAVKRLSLGETDAMRLSIRIEDYLERLPSAQPEIIRCKDCHFFEQDHFDSLNGVPIITAHNICTRWGDGCMTYENGYCFMGIRREKRDE